MAEFPYLPLFTDAYLADTRHLSTAEHGAYLLMLMTAWRTADCSLPNDDDFLGKIVCDPRNWPRWKKNIMPFFQVGEDGRLRQKRLLRERRFVDTRRRLASEAGKASALKRKETASTDVQPGANVNSTPTLTPNLSKKEPPIVPQEKTGAAEGLTPFDVIRCFDDCLATVFGEHRRRMGPTSNDKLDAADWIARGVTLEFLKPWLLAEMKKFKDRTKNDDMPNKLRFFHTTIGQALGAWQTKIKNKPRYPLPEDQEDYRRLQGWHNTGFWMDEWGGPPGYRGCYISKTVLKENPDLITSLNPDPKFLRGRVDLEAIPHRSTLQSVKSM